MIKLSKGTKESLKKTFSVLTAVTTVLSLTGVMLVPVAGAVAPADYGLREGDVVSAAGSDDPDVYIVNEHGYKRLFLNPAIFGFYGHLGGFAAVKNVSPATRDAFGTSGLFRNCESGDERVYGVETTGEDVGMLHWVNTTGAQAVADDPNFFKKVFCINNNEFNWYSKGSNYTSVNQVPNYSRQPGSTPAPSGPLSVMVAPGNPGAQTLTLNAVGMEMLRVRFNGTGTVNTVTFKRLGAGDANDFANVYIYDGAKRLVSGKSFSTSNGEVTFLVNVPVSGWKDLSFVADMDSASNNAGNVSYIQLIGSTVSGGAAVSGIPVSGNMFTSSGASSGGVTITKTGSLSNPTVGQKGVQVSEFKITANTEAASVKRLTLLNGGNVKSTDLTNVKLMTGTNSWSGSVTADGYFVFDLGSGFTIAKGGNAVFKVYADISGKKDETIKLYFESDADTLAVGDQYNQGMAVTDTALDTSGEAHSLTLQGGALTLVFNGPSAQTVGTQASDVTLLRYSMTAASNIEVRKTELTLCASTDGTTDTTFEDASNEADWDDLTDVKVWNEANNTVVMGPKDGTAFNDADDTGSCPDSQSGAQEIFTDVFDLLAGQTYNFKVTGDIDTSLGGFLDTDDIVRVVLDDYSDDAGDTTVMKYSGTTTAVAAADIVPRADISGNNVTLSSASLTLSLAGTPADQTKIRGTQDVDVVGITFAAGQASALTVTTVKLTGYAAETSSGTFDEGVAPSEDTGISVGSAVQGIELWDGSTMVAGSGNVTNNSLSTGGTGTITFGNLNWNIPAGTAKTLLVRADLSNNTASGTAGDAYAFDIAATGDVTAIDKDSNTVNPGSAAKNGTTSPTQVLTVKNNGSLTLATSADSPGKGAVYWGQVNAPVSKFRITSTDEGQYIEKLTIASSVAAETVDAAANVKEVSLTYKNKAGSTLTVTNSFGSGASVNFAWAAGDANRPYVPKDSNLDIAVNANMKTKAEGATQDSNSAVFFSLDLVDKFNGSHADGFRAVGEGSGTVIDGTGTNINDVVGANDQYVYRVFPKFDVVTTGLPDGDGDLIGTPVVFKFSVTAMGLADSTLRFDNENAASGTIKFEIISSGNAAGDTSVSTYDDSTNELIDSVTLTDDGELTDASYTMDFTTKDVEITGGSSKTFRIQLNSTSVYDETGDYLQVILRDASAEDTDLVRWVGNYDNTTGSLDSSITAGTLRNLPLFGPSFDRN